MKPSIQFILLLVALVTISCNAQNKPGVKTDIHQPIRNSGQPKLVRTLTTDEYRNVHCGLQDAAGNLWFATSGEGVYRYDGNKFTNFTTQDGLSDNNVSTIFQDKSGVIWFCTDGGICRYDGNAFTRFLENDKRLGSMVSSMFEDSKGNFWFGTATNGLYRYNGDSLTVFRYNTIMDIVEDKGGALWFCSWNRGGAVRYANDTFTDFVPIQDGITDDMIFCAMQDKAGNIWFGTRNNGVCKYDGKHFINFTKNEAINDAAVYDIHADKSGNLWFATESDGVWRYDPSAELRKGSKSFTSFSTVNGLTHNSVFSILEDKQENLWFGTRNVGLCKYDGKSFTAFSK